MRVEAADADSRFVATPVQEKRYRELNRNGSGSLNSLTAGHPLRGVEPVTPDRGTVPEGPPKGYWRQHSTGS
jgi:hypothetical protein